MSELKQREPYETKLMFKQRQISHLVSENKTLKESLRLMGDDLYGHIWAQNCHIENGVPSKEELVNRYISKATTQATPEGG